MQKFSLTNLKTGKVRYYESEDAGKAIIDMRFKLDMGMYPDKELQDEYASIGLEVFRFDIIS